MTENGCKCVWNINTCSCCRRTNHPPRREPSKLNLAGMRVPAYPVWVFTLHKNCDIKIPVISGDKNCAKHKDKNRNYSAGNPTNRPRTKRILAITNCTIPVARGLVWGSLQSNFQMWNNLRFMTILQILYKAWLYVCVTSERYFVGWF